jgi:hypothetical protein
MGLPNQGMELTAGRRRAWVVAAVSGGRDVGALGSEA